MITVDEMFLVDIQAEKLMEAETLDMSPYDIILGTTGVEEGGSIYD